MVIEDHVLTGAQCGINSQPKLRIQLVVLRIANYNETKSSKITEVRINAFSCVRLCAALLTTYRYNRFIVLN